MKNQFLAGVGKALLIRDNNLIGVARTLTESTFSFSITPEEIRGGASNALWGKYFHDSNLNVTLTDSMFSLDYMAAALGTNVESGGLSIKEEQLTAAPLGNKVTVTEDPVATDGVVMGWYKKPSEENWHIGTFSGKDMTVSGAKPGDIYCVKYFFYNENARSITIDTQYIPSELHVVIINDLYAGDEDGNKKNANTYGRLITDIPRLQLDGNEDLSLTASGAATMSLSGSALAVSSSKDSCEDKPYYGTMTEEIFGKSWKEDVAMIAVEGGDIEVASGATETLSVYAVFGNGMPSQLKANSNFTFAIEDAPASTASDTRIDAETGVITGGSVGGTCVVSVTLKEAPVGVAPAYVLVTALGA